MIAAIYARKSTEQPFGKHPNAADEELKSVKTQITNARRFAAARGWSVPDAHVYADEAVSGAETKKLVQRQRLLDLIESEHPPFQILIVRDASRFSRRDGDEAFGELKRIAQAGIAIWFYEDGSRFTYGQFADNITGFVRAEMNAEWRRQIARWTFAAMQRKATKGYVTGGACFGYDNVRVAGHVEHRINEAHAAVIRQIFELSAGGWGYTRIAKHLNETGAPAPAPHRKRATGRPRAGWGPGTVREVIHRPRYRGMVIYNKTTKRDATGAYALSDRPEAEWVTYERPELRIVSEALWQAAHARLVRVGEQQNARGQFGAAIQRRNRDIDSKYLLSGFARCATCGGTLSPLTRGSHRERFYGCFAHAKRGATICDNALVLPVGRVDEAVLAELTRTLRPAVVRIMLDRVFEALKPRTVTANLDTLRAQGRALDTKIARLTAAIEEGKALAPLITQLEARQAEREALRASMVAAETIAQIQVDRRAIEREVLAELGTWREDLAAHGRDVFRKGLDGPIYFTPEGDTFRFEADIKTGTMIAGLVGIPPYGDSGRAHHKGWNLRLRGIAA